MPHCMVFVAEPGQEKNGNRCRAVAAENISELPNGTERAATEMLCFVFPQLERARLANARAIPERGR